MKTFILGDSQGKNKTVVLEKIIGESKNNYRMTICTRYPSFEKATAAFLSETPANHKRHYLKQIEEAKKQLRIRDGENDNKAV